MGTKIDYTRFEAIRIGDHVRLQSDVETEFGWTVIGRSFGSMTFDLAAGDPNVPEQILRGVRAALVERIEAAPEQEA